MKRLSLDAVVLLALLVLMAILSFAIARQTGDETVETRPHRTITSAQPGGWKAFALLLQEEGFRVQGFHRSPKQWLPGMSVMVAGEEYVALEEGVTGLWDKEEAKAALKWVEQGGTLLILTARSSPLTEQIGLDVTEKSKQGSVLSRLQPLPFLQKVEKIELNRYRWTKSPKEVLPLFADTAPGVVMLRRGNGHIIAVSSAAFADNKHLTDKDNARFLVQTVAAYVGKSPVGTPPLQNTVFFDEYHQGFPESDSLWNVLGRPGQFAVWQLLALVLIIAYSLGRRFGIPRPLPAAPRVSSEYVTSLANLYRRARASDAALEGIYQSFWRDLCHLVVAPTDAPAAEVVRKVVAQFDAGDTSTLGQRLGFLLTTCTEKIQAGGKIKEGELLDIARQLEAMRKELRLGRHA